MALNDAQNTEAAPDTSISYEDGIEYWNSVDSTVNGMLGGYPQISRIDIQGSSNFLAKLLKSSNLTSTAGSSSRSLGRVVDCGAGIGRITIGFLSKVATEVDIVEPVKKFTDEFEKREEVAGVGGMKEQGKCGSIYNVGLQDWTPQTSYDLIWNQWCLGHLTDTQLVEYFRRCGKTGLTSNGWIVVKENTTRNELDTDIFDEVDSSVTRTDRKLRELFGEAGLKIVATEQQKGFPKGLFPVRMYALRPM